MGVFFLPLLLPVSLIKEAIFQSVVFIPLSKTMAITVRVCPLHYLTSPYACSDLSIPSFVTEAL